MQYFTEFIFCGINFLAKIEGNLTPPPLIIESLSTPCPRNKPLYVGEGLVAPLWSMSLHWQGFSDTPLCDTKSPSACRLYTAPEEFVRTLKGRLYVGDAPA